MPEGGVLGWIRRQDAVSLSVLAALLAIAGVLIIVFPLLLRWAVGLALILGGVAVLAAAIANKRESPSY